MNNKSFNGKKRSRMYGSNDACAICLTGEVIIIVILKESG